MSHLTVILIWVGIIGAVFIWAWRRGYVARLSLYVQQTREELRKCTWPTWEELKGSTVVVVISIILLGLFTVVVDRVFFFMVFQVLKA